MKVTSEVPADTIWIRGGDEQIWAECGMCGQASARDEELNLNDVLLWACDHSTVQT